MATEIGIIKALVGTATATATDGTIRNLQVGDKVYQNDLITTGAAGAVEIEFADGSTMDMGRSSQAMLDLEVFDPSTATTETAETTETTDDIAAIQQALLEGEDPTVAGEATAAGAGAGGGSEGGHDFVVREYLNPEVTPDNGFETTGPGAAFLQSEEELNELDDAPTAGITEVLLDEDDLITDGQIDLSDVSAEFLAYLNLEFGIDAFGFNSPQGVGDERTDIGDDVGSPDGHFLGGSLVANYGFNGPSPTDPIIFNVVSGSDVTDSEGNPVTSQGQQVQYWVSADGLTVIGYIAGGFPGNDFPGDDFPGNDFPSLNQEFDGCQPPSEFPGFAQIIFTAQLTPTIEGGEFLVGIFGQFDHEMPDYENGEFVFENNMFLNLGFTISDADGDTATGTLQINVDDDSPVRAGDEEAGLATQTGLVYEDGLSFENDDLSEGNQNAVAAMTITSDESDAEQSDIESFLGLSAGALEPAVDSNGGAGNATNGSAAKTTLTVEAGDIISFSWVFDNGESGSEALEFNDFAFVVINGEVFELADSGAGNLQPSPFTYEVTSDGEITIGFGQMNVGDTGVDSSLSVSDLTLNGNPVNGGFDDSLTGWDTLGNVSDSDSLLNSDVATGNLNSLVNMGADGPGFFALLQPSENEFQQAQYQAAMDSLPTLSSQGEAVTYSIESNGFESVLIATAGEGEDAREVFTLTVNLDGTWTFDLNDQLDHVEGETAEENFSLITLDENGEQNGSVDSIDFTQLLQIRDFDGDQLIITEDDAGMFTISIQDDIPVVGESNALVDDDALEGGNDGGVADDNGEASFTGTLDATVGSDEPAVFSFAPMNGQTAMIGTEEVTFSYDSETNTLTATGPRGDLFTVELTDTASGDYTVTLLDNVLHESLDGLEGDNTENNAFADLTYSITDEDGDTIEGALNVNFDDDTPTVVPYEVNTMRIISDDDTVPGFNGNPGGVGDSNEFNQVKTLQFSVGADGGTVAWNVDTSSVEDATAGITFQTDADGSLLILQDQGGEAPVQVAIITLDENSGDYVYTQTANVIHTPGNDENEASFKLGFTVTDGDGDTAEGYVTLLIDDDTPTVADFNVNTMRIISDDDSVAGLDGNPGGVGDSNQFNLSGTLQFSAGADGGTVAWNLDNTSVDDATAGISFSVDDDGTLILTQEQDGEQVQIATVTLDEVTGDYVYTQTDNLLHTPGDDENNADFTLGFTVTDGDGDTADGNLTLRIDDDTPVITAKSIQILSESFENFADINGNNFTVVYGEDGQIIGNNGTIWNVNAAGIEIQSGNVGGSEASDGNVHAELDTDNNDTLLANLSTEIGLPTPDVTLSFDYKPRPDNEDDSDMQVSLGDKVLTINSDAAGNITFGGLPEGVTASQETNPATGWTTITLSYTGLSTAASQTLAFEGLGNANEFGAYLDNINVNATVALTVDESVLTDGNGEAGATTSASYDFSSFFTTAFGADGPADETSESYSLNLNGEDIASGLYAVDNTDTNAGDSDGYGQGAEIVLNQVGDQIIGSAGGVPYFTISVNAETGQVTLTQLDNVWHADTTNPDDSQGMVLDAGVLSLVKTITDADEDSAEATLDLSGVNFNFEDDAPTIAAEQPAQPYLLTITNEGGDAGYNNTYGYYIKGENGEPVSGEIIWANVKDNESAEITIEVTDPSDIGFFIIPDGADLNELNNGDAVTFEQDGEGNWQVVLDGTPLSGQDTNVLFNDAGLNPDNADAQKDNGAAGNQNWEDIIGGDNDFNDVNINVSINQLGAITVDETDIGNDEPNNATDSQSFATSFTAAFGADGPGTVGYSLTANTEVGTGLVDTLSGEDVELRVNDDGEVEGFITSDGSEEVVFTVSVDGYGVVTLTQLRAVEHDDVTDPDEANSPAILNAGALALVATATDADGDTASDSIDLGVLMAFEDDGPSIGEQAANSVDEGNTTTGTLVFDAGQDGGGISHIDGELLTFDEVDGYSDDIDLDHGTIKVKANGEYSYTVDSGAVEQDEVENFNFTVTDGDGDTAQGAVTITIVNAQVNAVITLEDVTVDEGTGTATITANVDSPVTGEPLIITLSNNVTITIPVNGTTGTSEPFSVQGDDPYIDNESYEVSVDNVTGGNFSNVDDSDTATVTINDTIDTVTVVLTATESTGEDGGLITYTAEIQDAEGNPVNTQTGVTVELDNGEMIVIAANTSSNSIDVPVGRDDVYLEDDSITAAIEDVTETDAGEENAFEDLQFNGDDVTTEITDDQDAVIVKLTATESTGEDGGSITYTASLEDAEGNTVTTNNAITVVLVNGEEITIEANDSDGSVTIDVNRDDVFVEDDAITNAIESVTESDEGEVGAFESLQADNTEVSTDINDDEDTVTATLTASPAELSEDGGDITYTITLSGGPGAIDPNTPLTFTLENNDPDDQPITITINPGSTTGSVDVSYDANDVTAQTAITNSIASVVNGGQYEDLDLAGETSVGVDTTPEITNLTPEAQGGDAIVDEDDLAADRGPSESAGTDGSDSTTVQGSFNISAADGVGNLTVGTYAVITNGVFNGGSLDTPMGNTLNFTGYNPTTGEVSYEYTLNDNTLDHGIANNGENDVFENFDVLLTDADGDEATDTLSVQIVDDVPEIAPLTFGAIEDGQTLSDISLESLFGADGAGDIAFDPALHDSAVLQNGEQVFFDGEALTWSLNGDVLTATTGSDVDAITITLNDADGNYDISVAEGTFYLEGDEQSFAIGDLSGSNALAWVGQSEGIDTLIISEGTSTNTSNAGGVGYVGAGSQWIDAGTADSTTFYFYDSIDADTGAIGDQAELDAALDGSVVAGVNSFSISVNTQGGNTTTLQLAFVAVDGTLGTVEVDIPSNGPSSPYLLEIDSSDITWEGGATGLAIASVEFPASDVDYRVGGDLVFNEITPTDIQLDLPVTITDADGDVDDGNITGTITSEGVVSPLALTEIPDELYVGTNEPNSKVTEGGNDVLIGDLGGREQQFNPGKAYSIALIADESGSMEGSKLTLLKDALESFVNDLADHDGVINIALIGFGPGANLEISVSNLANNPDGLDALLAEIDDLAADGGTNYEAAFDEAVEWFQSQPDGHEFISYFMTDGDPTLYGNDQGPGDETDYETLLESVEAFAALSGISEVNAIGIGNSVNTDYLRFFDNTNSNGTGTEIFDFDTVSLANFEGNGSDDPLESGWSVDASNNDGRITRQWGDFFTVEDRGRAQATVATSATFMVTVPGSVLSFEYRTDYEEQGDTFSWELQKLDGVNWTTVQSDNLNFTGGFEDVDSQPLEAGQYRIVYTADNGGSGDEIDYLDIDNIELRVPDDVVSGPVGEPQIINNAGELIAELQGGNTTDTPVDLGDDVLQGGDGDDVIFGDTIFTDNLTWTNGEGEEIEAGHGLGYEGLVEYLTWAENGGVAPDDAQIMQYIRDNYESLINPNPTQAEMDAAGNDTLIGGAGNDILIGGDGADIFQWNEGDDGSTDAPAVDYVVDFDAGEGDVLDVSDLLNTADASDNLDNYLVANYDSNTDQTTIDVYTNGDAQQSGAQSTQSIVLNGQYEQQDLATLVNNNNLNVDQS